MSLLVYGILPTLFRCRLVDENVLVVLGVALDALAGSESEIHLVAIDLHALGFERACCRYADGGGRLFVGDDGYLRALLDNLARCDVEHRYIGI